MSLLQLQLISKAFGGRRLLADLSMELVSGEIIGIVGSNGSGKTTLFNVISGLEKADAGQIILHGQIINDLSVERRAGLGIGRLFQQPRVFQNLTLEENLLAAVNGHPGEMFLNYFIRYQEIGQFESDKRVEAKTILRQIRLEKFLSAKAGTLSYGQQKLLTFGMMLINNPKLILLDEFFAGVSSEMIVEMTGILKDLANRGVGILMVEHNMETLSSLCNEILRLEHCILARVLNSELHDK